MRMRRWSGRRDCLRSISLYRAVRRGQASHRLEAQRSRLSEASIWLHWTSYRSWVSSTLHKSIPLLRQWNILAAHPPSIAADADFPTGKSEMQTLDMKAWPNAYIRDVQ